MEVRPGGPLSYDLSVPDRDPSAQRGIVLGLLSSVAAWVTAVVGGWFALGVFSDPRAVTRFFPLLVIVAGVGATWLGTRRTMRHARRNGLLIIGAITTVGALIAFSTLANVKPTIPQIRQQLDEVPLPPGFTVASEDTRGDRFCRNGCPRIDRIYTTPKTDPDPVRTMVLAMYANGWDKPADIPAELSTTAQQGEIFVQLSETAPQTVRVTAARQS